MEANAQIGVHPNGADADCGDADCGDADCGALLLRFLHVYSRSASLVIDDPFAPGVEIGAKAFRYALVRKQLRAALLKMQRSGGDLFCLLPCWPAGGLLDSRAQLEAALGRVAPPVGPRGSRGAHGLGSDVFSGGRAARAAR